jgi:hypothetical protein
MTIEAEAVNAIADLARGGEPGIITEEGGDGRRWLLVPNNMKAEEVTDPHGLKPRPAYVKQSVTLHTELALATYVNRFKTADTVMFADAGTGKIRAVLDYHEETQPTGWTTSAPNVTVGVLEQRAAVRLPSKANFGGHHAILELRHTEAWKEWTANNDDANGLFERGDFVAFLEEHRRDITAPDAATLLEMCRTLRGLKKVTFGGADRDTRGNVVFEYRKETAVENEGKVPFAAEFVIAIPVYYGQASRLIDAVLRWSVSDGAREIGYHLQGVADARQAAFEAVLANLFDLTGVPVYQGALGG